VTSVGCFRLYGDTNGNGVVAPVDLARLRRVLRREGDWRRWLPLFVPATAADVRRLVLFILRRWW
jgi:hypothetical protein